MSPSRLLRSRAGQRSESFEDIGEAGKGVAQRPEFPGRRAARGGAAGQALDVADAVQGLALPGPPCLVLDQHL